MQTALKQSGTEERLEQVAREYQDFAYIVSHDLSAPLRHVREFTRLLVGARQANLSDEEREYVQFLERSLHKLDDMQKALLAFSRLNTRAGELADVNCNDTVAAALKDLSEVIQKHSPAFESDELPLIKAEPKHLQMLFYSLLDNAFKFHEEDSPKRKVAIRVTDQKDSWLFEVRDNGIGIEEAFQEEVFKMFRRLEPEKYSGIGAGLTIAHKIVQQHGGEMLIESKCGEGTSVFFSLPK